MPRPYEAVFIFDSALEEPAITEKLNRFFTLVPQPAETPAKFNHWGKRTLAYPIKKRETGYYVIANFQADPPALPEFERALKLDDGVLRFLVVDDEHDYAPVRAAADRKFEEDDE